MIYLLLISPLFRSYVYTAGAWKAGYPAVALLPLYHLWWFRVLHILDKCYYLIIWSINSIQLF